MGEDRESERPPRPASDHPREDPDPERADGEKRRRFEGQLPDLVKRIVERAAESAVEKLVEGPERLRNFVGGDVKKEILHSLYGQIDDSKNGLYRAVAKEIRDFLEHTHFSDEITNALTKLSFEVKMEVRFIPNQAATGERAEGGDEPGSAKLPKPEVRAEVNVKDRGRDTRRREGS